MENRDSTRKRRVEASTHPAPRCEDCEFYDYDEDTMTLKGQTHGKVFQMGMRVRVVCTDVQREKGQVTFSLLERRNHD